ncbi:MAG TPA: cytochrome P450 [Acidimicrobiales bacterium]|nr:cytochrome P450 [Acidimicrobiales bacterium]
MVDATYNPFEPGFADDPYDQYSRIREAGRTQRSLFDNLLIHRYDDCFALLRQAGTSVDDTNANVVIGRQIPPELLQGREQRGRHAILNLDPPDHTRIRRLVSKAFTMRRVEQLRPRVRELVDGFLDDVAERGTDGSPVDLMTHFAFPLPFQVITELLGMPSGDRDQLRVWSHSLTRVLEPVLDDVALREVAEAFSHMQDYVDEAIGWKRRNPADDLLSGLIAAEEDGDSLSADELVDQVVLLYLAGHETTVNLIGNGTLALLRNRDQLALLAADPSIEGNATDELLRYDTPVHVSRRIVMTEMEVAGETLGPGDLVVTLLAAANRDPAHWGPTAGQLDLRRQGAGAHLSFGSGIHHCLGAALARLEGSEALGALVRRFPALELATDTPDWNNRIVLRGLDTLDVAVAA